ncbi:MAG: hypothetical protein R3E12_02920 [Candidatus Eisenbacteria bacterium]
MRLQSRGVFAILGLSASLTTGIAAADASTEPRISPEAAIAHAINDLTPTSDGYLLRHPEHRVEFRAGGITVSPRRGPVWTWSLTGLHGTGNESQENPPVIAPESASPLQVSYRHGLIDEQYLLRARSVEQQFVIDAPLSLASDDLVIEGAVACDGVLARTEEGWTWRNPEGVVTLADVHVYDASGRTLPRPWP